MYYSSILACVTVGVAMALAPLANANNFYIGATYGVADTDDIDTSGNFTSDFTTGAVTGVTPPLTIPAGEKVNWDTELDDGDSYSLIVGMQFDMFRAEIELAATSNDVDSHANVTAAGIGLDGIDAWIEQDETGAALVAPLDGRLGCGNHGCGAGALDAIHWWWLR